MKAKKILFEVLQEIESDKSKKSDVRYFEIFTKRNFFSYSIYKIFRSFTNQKVLDFIWGILGCFKNCSGKMSDEDYFKRDLFFIY